MEIQWIGLVAAVATFFGVWFGHVAVRKIEFKAEKLWIPIILILMLGVSFIVWSLSTDNLLFTTATGILGMTLFWDSFELWRQQKRIIKGHAPANPNNPRHARILADNSSATTLDLLNRDPVGRPISPEEAVNLLTER